MVNAAEELERGPRGLRAAGLDRCLPVAFGRRRREPLGAEDLELLAMAAYMLGRDDDYLSGARARPPGAPRRRGTRCAPCAAPSGWACTSRFAARWAAPADGSAARQRLLEREEQDCVERGYLLLPVADAAEAAGDYEAAVATAARGRRDRRALRRRGPDRPGRARCRAGSSSTRGRSRRASRCWTRPWSR